MRRVLTLLALVALTTIPALGEVERLVAVRPTHSSGFRTEQFARVVFANGQEIRKRAPNAPVSDVENYAVLVTPDGYTHFLELRVTILGLTDTFEPKHFVRMFDVPGEVTGVDVLNRKLSWKIRARNTGLGTWIDPEMNR